MNISFFLDLFAYAKLCNEVLGQDLQSYKRVWRRRRRRSAGVLCFVFLVPFLATVLVTLSLLLLLFPLWRGAGKSLSSSSGSAAVGRRSCFSLATSMVLITGEGVRKQTFIQRTSDTTGPMHRTRPKQRQRKKGRRRRRKKDVPRRSEEEKAKERRGWKVGAQVSRGAPIRRVDCRD